MNGEEERERERWRQKRTSFVNLVVAIEFPCCPRSDISQDPLSLSTMCSSHGVWKPFRACNNKIAGAHTNASSAFQKPFYPLADCTSLFWRQITDDDKTYRRFRIIWPARCNRSGVNYNFSNSNSILFSLFLS